MESVFDSFSDVTMVPVESTYFQRQMDTEILYKPFRHVETPKGKLIHDSYRVAFEIL